MAMFIGSTLRSVTLMFGIKVAIDDSQTNNNAIYALFRFPIKEDKVTQIGEAKVNHSSSCYFPELLLSLWSELGNY